MTEAQYDIFFSDAGHQDPSSAIIFMPLDALTERTVSSIGRLFSDNCVAVVACSYGKDSSVMLACTLEAARRHLARTGLSPVVRVSTIDTLVDNPMAMKLARTMSARMLQWAQDNGLDVQQEWASPGIMNRYLVKMIGGRDIASTSAGDSRCAVDMKIRPVQSLKTRLRKEFAGRRIVTLIGTRHDESDTRSANMHDRGERFDVPVESDSGDWLMSPLSDWLEGHVWGFIDQIVGGEAPFPVFDDFISLSAMYESTGESTCSTDAFAGLKKKAGLGCGSGGRMGCWACQKTSQDHSLVKMLDTSPHYAPLVRLSRIIRAGHDVPSNRSFLGRSISDEGDVLVAGNAYSPQWQEQLLRFALSADQDELDWAQNESERLNRPVEPRFRVITDEEVVAIAFMWGRYGLHPAEMAMAIAADVRLGGSRYGMSDEEIALMAAKADRAACSRSFGRMHVMTSSDKEVSTNFGRVDVVVHLAGAVNHLQVDSRGVSHTPVNSDGSEIKVDLGDDPNLAMWFLMIEAENAVSGFVTDNPQGYFNFLLRQNVLFFPAGYLGRLRDYGVQASAMSKKGLGAVSSDPLALQSLDGYTNNATDSVQLSMV